MTIDNIGCRPVRTKPDGTSARINQLYDNRMYRETADRLYGGSDFFNLGYWGPDTRTHKNACENLMEILIGFIPTKEGMVLDVACGKGASTRYLSQYYPAKNIIGINISEKQLERCRANAGGSKFLLMDATRLNFPDACFDAVMCVEAAFHFSTREDFLREAFRVLKPGGYLVLSDILVTRWHENNVKMRVAANYIHGPRRYRQKLRVIGLQDIKIVDATNECWISSYNHILEVLERRLMRGEMSLKAFRLRRAKIFRKRRRTRYYLLVAARKPQ